MPELAFLGAVGALCSFLVIIIYGLRFYIFLSSKKIQTLNQNLQQVDKFWSLNQDQILPLEYDLTYETEKNKAIKTLIIFGTMSVFMSWLGLIFFSLYLISTKYLVRTNLEQKIFESELVSKPLSANEVQVILESLS